MPVNFSRDRMDEVRANYDMWWQHKLERPLLQLTIPDAHPDPEFHASDLLSQANCHEFSVSPEEVIDRIDRRLGMEEYLGDGFPFVNFDSFGPGVLCAFCGGRLDNSSGAVWFYPDKPREIGDIHVKYDPQNKWVQRIKAIYRAGLAKWNGSVIMGMPDLGGVLDVVAALRGSENLLVDLLDEPEEVERVASETQTAWYEAYNDLSSVLAPQGGYSDWSHLLSTATSYIIQCDFCYMIGNPMFREFVLGTLRRDTETLTNIIYHLDGVGELNHLDDVLSLEKLKAVQWVYGDGKPSAIHWLDDVYRKIAASGKQMWIVGGPQDFLDIISNLHLPLYSTQYIPSKDMEIAKTMLAAR